MQEMKKDTKMEKLSICMDNNCCALVYELLIERKFGL